MDDIRRQDRRLFLRELFSPSRLVLTLAAMCSILLYMMHRYDQTRVETAVWICCVLGIGTISAVTAYSASEKRRFYNDRMKALWLGCQDRLTRFDEVLRRSRREHVAELREMPKTIRELSRQLYLALRRADIVAHEVSVTEQGLLSQPPVWEAAAHDPQSKELYRLADKNIAEYRAQFAGVMAGVQRTEAQSAVFMTTLDSLRMKLIGYRLAGRSPEVATHDFLESLAEARAQLDAIDKALDELDFSHYPHQISVVPPPIPADVLRNISS